MKGVGEMDFDHLMKGLGHHLGLTEFEANADRCYRLSLDGVVVSIVERHEEGIVETLAELCELPHEGADRVCRVLLAAQAPGAAEAYAFFLAPETQTVCIRRRDALGRQTVESYVKILEDFANMIEVWTRSIRDFSHLLPTVHAALETHVADHRAMSLSPEGFLQV